MFTSDVKPFSAPEFHQLKVPILVDFFAMRSAWGIDVKFFNTIKIIFL